MVELEWEPKNIRQKWRQRMIGSRQLSDAIFSIHSEVLLQKGGGRGPEVWGCQSKTAMHSPSAAPPTSLEAWNSRSGSSPAGALQRKRPEITQSGGWRQHLIFVTGHWSQSGRGMDLATKNECSAADGLACSRHQPHWFSLKNWPASSQDRSLLSAGCAVYVRVQARGCVRIHASSLMEAQLKRGRGTFISLTERMFSCKF